MLRDFEEVGGAHSKLSCWALTELIDLCSANTGGGRSSDQKQELGGWALKGSVSFETGEVLF